MFLSGSPMESGHFSIVCAGLPLPVFCPEPAFVAVQQKRVQEVSVFFA
ncbi:hypothetical protein HMPREF9371_1808 [Neisseria shayeganii 871]|uniref:Uncharacterized protein n=1 Tax=Neisseria shayeganii 871 TaxID=1032488 RepID=G4CJL8_9NEIS|nr:hypothetical protein HMPREF9371_1808 [Neisseria shayeganii 871]